MLVMEVQMDQKRVHALLREERDRLERLRSLVDADHDPVARADEVAEDLADGADRRTVEETDGVPEDDEGRIFPLPDGRGDGS